MGRNYKKRVRRRIRHLDHSQVPTPASAPQRHSGSVPARPILDRPGKNILDFLLVDFMTVDVRLPGLGVQVEAKFHVAILFTFTKETKTPLTLPRGFSGRLTSAIRCGMG